MAPLTDNASNATSAQLLEALMLQYQPQSSPDSNSRLQPPTQEFFRNLDATVQQLIGHELFTVLAYSPTTSTLARIYTSNPIHYPLSGRKLVTPSTWTRSVLIDGELYIGHARNDLKRVFSEYERLWAMNIGSVVNVPVKVDGEVIGALAILGDEGAFRGVDVDLLWRIGGCAARAVETCRGEMEGIKVDLRELESV